MAYNSLSQSSSQFDNQVTHQSHDGYQASSSPEPNGNGAASGVKHRRNYQACDPCRERKVKCDMGSVDDPHDPPCRKCRREQKACTFARTRKKNADKSSEEPDAKRQRTNSNSHLPQVAQQTFSPQIGAGYAAQSTPLPPISPGMYPPPSPVGIQIMPNRANYASHPRSVPQQSAMGTSMSLEQPQDNLSRSSSSQPQPKTRMNGNEEHYVSNSAKNFATNFTNTDSNMSVLLSAAQAAQVDDGGSPFSDQKSRARAFTGGTSDTGGTSMNVEQAAARKHAIDVWNRMRFVRAGWFTAVEAIGFVEYFYDRLAPMTPVVTQDFRSPAKHEALLTEEPVLALAILAISSRHFTLESNASISRNYYIHETLWNALRRTIQRLLWGQEQFGGGLCGAGMAPIRESTTELITWKGSLRTLGTIEALLLLTDWQPRALHFPPGDDENRLVDPRHGLLVEKDHQNGESGMNDVLPYAGWLEPAWRSDRMSWMLLGLAQSLSFELGVFDTKHIYCGGQHGPKSSCLRKRRIRRLVILYTSQISGRIGIQASLSPNQDRDDQMRESNEPIDVMQKLWFDIASIMYDANRDIFPSRQYTNNLIQTGRHKEKIALFVPRLNSWRREFDRVQHTFNEPMRHVLAMEYEYSRLYINSLGLQKVVESWVHQGSTGHQSLLVPIVEENKLYIDEVTDAALQILNAVVSGLAPSGNLRDAPVRTFLRSLSGMMFTLKLFSLGNDARTIRELFKKLSSITEQMDQQVVDDVHLSAHTARLINVLMTDVKRSMIRVQKHGSREQSRQLSPQPGEYAQALHQNGNNGYTPGNDNESPDPLAEIPFANYSTQTFMPPPNFNPQSMDDSNINIDASMDPAMFGGLDNDWLAIPLDNLFSTSSNTVNQGFGGIGPTLGDRDMLAILTGAQYDQNQPQNYGNFGGF